MSCEKRSYPSKRAAKKALKSARGRGGERPIRTYKCGVCGEWHLTKSPRRKIRVLPWT